MRRLSLLLLLAGVACRREPAGEELFRQAFTLYQQGELKRAAAMVKAHAARASDSATELHWQWLLLDAELTRIQSASAKAALEKLPDPPPPGIPHITALWNVRRCAVLSDLRRFEEAKSALAAARAAMDDNTPVNTRFTADTCEIFTLSRNGEHVAAEQVSQRLLAAASEKKSDYFRAMAYTNLAYSNYRVARFDTAASYGEQAVAAAQAAGAKRLIAAASVNLGTAYDALGDYEQAMPLLDRAAGIAGEIDYPYARQNALGEQGNVYFYQRQCEQAIPRYREAFEVAESKWKPNAPKWAGNLAVCEIDLNHLDEAEKWNVRAAELSGGEGSGYYLSNSVEIWRRRGDLDRAFSECRTALKSADAGSDLERALHAQLASLYIERHNLGEARREYELALRNIEEKQKQLKGEAFQVGFFARLIRHYQAYVDALVAEHQDGAALEIAERSRARVLADRLHRTGRSTTSFDARSLARRTRSVLMSYWLGDERSYLWVVNGSATKLFPLPPAKDIEALVTTYRNTVEKTREDPLNDAAGKRLYEILVQPAAALIPAGSHVVVVPDRSLHSLNLETLPVPGNPPHYWIQDVTLSVAPSLAILDVESKAARNRSVLLIGAPAVVDGRYPELPGAREEMTALREIFASANPEVYEGAAATPAAFLQSRPGNASIIHFAAHGESNWKTPQESAVVLSKSAAGFKLYAREIVDLPLTAELVTISACRTAGSRSYAGEGAIGFAWAFLQAGARTVIAGLWDVRDRPTAALMRNLYEHVARDESPPDALRAAKLAILDGKIEQWRRPVNWGAFQSYVRSLPAPK